MSECKQSLKECAYLRLPDVGVAAVTHGGDGQPLGALQLALLEELLSDARHPLAG